MGIQIYRLIVQDPASWQMMPMFEARVRAFLKEFSPEFDSVRTDRFIAEMRNRWVNMPALAGYCIIMAGGDTPLEQKAVGHILSWVQDLFGKPYIMLFQLACDETWETPEMVNRAMAMCREWVGALNATLKAQNAPQLIENIQHWTVRSPEAWARLLPEVKQMRKWTVMEIPV